MMPQTMPTPETRDADHCCDDCGAEMEAWWKRCPFCEGKPELINEITDLQCRLATHTAETNKLMRECSNLLTKIKES